MDRPKIILATILAIVFFLVGGGAGMLYQKQQSDFYESLHGVANLKTLSSGVIASIAAYGQVDKIDGRNITLSYSGSSLTIPVSESASIVSVVSSVGEIKKMGSQKQANFSDIKEGENLSINIKISADGSITGTSVVILP